jgi:hypothetical protein
MINTEIEKTLASLDGLQRAEANPFLYEKIRQRIARQKAGIYRARAPILRLAAVCMVLMVLNLLSWVRVHQGTGPRADAQGAMQQIYGDYISSSRIADF